MEQRQKRLETFKECGMTKITLKKTTAELYLILLTQLINKRELQKNKINT